MGTVPTISGVFSMSWRRNTRVLPELERSMMASAPNFSAMATFSHSWGASWMSPEMPRLTLTFVRRPSPTPQAWRFGWLMFAGIAIRPAATPSRTNSGSRNSSLATCAICGVISPRRAASICVIRTPFVGIARIRFKGRAAWGRSSQPGRMSQLPWTICSCQEGLYHHSGELRQGRTGCSAGGKKGKKGPPHTAAGPRSCGAGVPSKGGNKCCTQ